MVRQQTILCLCLISGLMVGCGKEEGEATTSVSGSSSTSNTATRWSQSVFPISLEISNDFSSSERITVQSTAADWEVAVSNEINFFTTTGATTELGHADISDYLDGEMGVYKLTTWPAELPTSALAVTQLFGTRRNAGASNEYIELFEADIMVNVEYYSFATSSVLGDGLYDLNMVMVHELGHFLGLSHTTSEESVMYPSIGTGDDYSALFDFDVDTINANYSVDTSSQAVISAASALPAASAGISKPVRLVMELRADGTCHHYENGFHTHSH